MDADDLAAYLARLGVEREPPSADALARLHRAHVERVPYETLWIHAGERWGIDPADSVRRIAHGSRGGYCFHLNGAFAALLAGLGYRVRRHVGGVHGPAGPAAGDVANHLVLSVTGLPTEEHPDGTWYVDVGLGDALHEPLPLAPGTFRQAPWALGLEATPGGAGDWHLTHDPAGGFTGMAWRAEPTEGMAAFAAQHAHLSTSPDSGFVQVFTAQARDATGVTVLRGLVVQRIGAGASRSTIASPDELAQVLGDLFALDLGSYDAATRAALWERLLRAHEAWQATQA